MGSKILITKDAMLPEYIGCYGGKVCSTPNIDRLGRSGTVFYRHYTVAPSTAMAFTGMFTGLYPYMLEREKYEEVNEFSGETLFDLMNKKGYETHLIWSKNYVVMAERFSRCYGKNTIHHNHISFNQSAGHNAKISNLPYLTKDSVTDGVMSQIRDVIDEILSTKQSVFIWIHFPQVIAGRFGYGQDIDVFDQFVGDMISIFGEENIIISSDHGHMNGSKGKYGYGFDLYENAIRIPLITPRIHGEESINFPTTNAQLMEIICDGEINQREYIVADTAYYVQDHRKVAIISGDYKYIYNKKGSMEEMYNILIDSCENNNLLQRIHFDKDRKARLNNTQVYYNPHFNKVEDTHQYFKSILVDIWRTPAFSQKVSYFFHKWIVRFKMAIKRHRDRF